MENKDNNLEPQRLLRGSGVPASMLVLTRAPAQGERSPDEVSGLKSTAANEARGWRPTNEEVSHKALKRKWSEASGAIKAALDGSLDGKGKDDSTVFDRSGLQVHARLLETALGATRELPGAVRRLPKVVAGNNQVAPRAYVAVAAYLRAVDWNFNEETFVAFLEGIHQGQTLTIGELWLLKPLTQMVLLEEIARLLSAPGWARGSKDADAPQCSENGYTLRVLVGCLRALESRRLERDC